MYVYMYLHRYLPMYLSTYHLSICLSMYLLFAKLSVCHLATIYLCIFLSICQYSSIYIYHLSSIHPLFLHCIPVNLESYTIYLVSNVHLSSINLSINLLSAIIYHTFIYHLPTNTLSDIYNLATIYYLSFFLVINQLSIHLYLWV